MDDTAATSQVMFSRPTSSAMPGKQTVPLKTLVSDEVEEDFKKFARENGFGSTSDCLRELVMCAIYGAEHLVNLHRKRIEALARNVTDKSPFGGQG